MIVIRIVGDDARHTVRRSHGGHATYFSHDPQWRQTRLCKTLGKFFALNDIEQLRHKYWAAEQLEHLHPGIVEQTPGWAMRRKHC